MEHRHALQLLGLLDAEDDLALLVSAGVALAGQHHAHGPLLAPAQLDVVGAAFRNGQHDVHEVGLQARQHDLRLGIAEARVELQHLRAFGREHEASVQHAAVIVGEVGGRGGRGLLHDLMHGGQLVGRHDGHRRVHAHAARVRAAVAVEGALVVLGRGHAVGLAAAHEREQRALGAGEAFLYDHGGAGLAERAIEAGAHGFFRRLLVLGHDDALARRQAIGLHHDRGLQRGQVAQRRLEVVEAAVARGGNAVGIHEALAERLASLKLGALGIGAEHGDAGLAQLVGHARDERRLGADDHELHVVLLHERQHRGRPRRQDRARCARYPPCRRCRGPRRACPCAGTSQATTRWHARGRRRPTPRCSLPFLSKPALFHVKHFSVDSVAR